MKALINAIIFGIAFALVFPLWAAIWVDHYFHPEAYPDWDKE